VVRRHRTLVVFGAPCRNARKADLPFVSAGVFSEARSSRSTLATRSTANDGKFIGHRPPYIEQYVVCQYDKPRSYRQDRKNDLAKISSQRDALPASKSA